MRILAAIVLFAAVLPFQAKQNPSENRTGNELKHWGTTLPSGEPVQFTAMDVSRTWDTAVVHFRGNVKAEIRESMKAGDRYLAIRADGMSYYEKIGDIIPSGNVRIAQEQLK